MLKFLKARKAKKMAHEVLRASRHLRNMRGDLMSKDDLLSLADVEADLRDALESKDVEAVSVSSERLESRITELSPQVSFAGFRENLEVIVVAVVVAMGFRAYFLQPFKIPTGSMQPTLYGIVYDKHEDSSWMDVQPFRFAKWIVTGDTYLEYRAKSSGVLMPASGSSQEKDTVTIGGVAQKVPGRHYVTLNYAFGDLVKEGDLLWSGTRKAGDHVFVDRLSWNLRKPYRGEVSVFLTTGIASLTQNIHYIKRMVALPGKIVSIRESNLCIDGVPVEDPRSIAMERYEGVFYPPYRPAGHFSRSDGQRPVLLYDRDNFKLGDNQYFMFGDNAASSLDSRFWGAAPESNLVGPAWVVYWPFTRRWGRIR